MFNKLYRRWLGVGVIAALILLAAPLAAQTTTTLPLAAPGPFTVGLRLISSVDANRNNRSLLITLWYPAFRPDTPDKQQRILGQPDVVGWLRAVPDLRDAPYPLILYSHGSGRDPADRRESALLLASHGYVVAAVTHPNDMVQTAFVDRPLDISFTLNQLAAITTGDLAGLIDTNNVGVMGDSFGAYTMLLMTGARIEPDLAADWASKPSGDFLDSNPLNFMQDWDWNQLSAYRATFAPPLTSDALWPSFSDPRIHAAVMNSPCFASLFSEQSLAAATVPSLIVAGTADTSCSYQEDAAYLFTHLGSPDQYLLTFIEGVHVPGMIGLAAPTENHILVAFFNYYLKGQQADAQYLTTEYIESIEAQLKLGLLWGAYSAQ